MANANTNSVKLSDVMDHLKSLEEKVSSLGELKDKVDHIDEVLHSRPRLLGSMRRMTEDDAHRILLGDLKDKTNRECGDILGLSYGQVYSARNGYTFAPIYREWEAAQKTKKPSGRS